MPVGPHILCDEKARKSQSRARTSTGMWGTDWAASTIASAPAAWAASTSSRTGLMVPKTLETAVKEKSLVRSVRKSPSRSRASVPSSWKGR